MSSKSKGDAWERAVVAELLARGHRHAERAYRLGAHADRGDIEGIAGFLLECKDTREHKLAAWLDEAIEEAEPLGVTPALIVKRRGKPAARAYVVIELGSFADLLRELDE